MSRKSLIKSESAAAIAIAAVLLLGLAFTIISVVKLNYAPEWKINAEKDYSYDAWSSMEDVKTRAEIFTKFMGSDINYPYGLSATVPFSMGGGDVPVFEPSKSNSKLAINTEKCAMTITLAKYSMNPHTVDCGGITYYSKNRQYPDQIFRYENGALILAQGENSQMKRNPSFNIKKIDTNGNYTVIINSINLTGETKSISSSTSTALRLTGDSIMPSLNSSKDHPNEIIDSFNLSISTRYTDAWTTYLNNTAKDAGLKYGINYTINSTDDNVCLFFLPTGNNYSIYVNQTVLCAELGRKVEGGSLPAGSGNIMKLDTWYYFDTFTGKYNNAQISPSPSPNLLKDYDSNLVFPQGSFEGLELTSYTPSNSYSHEVTKNNNLVLNFGFVNFEKFENIPPSSATVRMVYRYERNNSDRPDMNMQFTGSATDSFNPQDNWRFYNNTFSVSPSSPTDLTFNVELAAQNKEDGIFYIDYLAVRLD